MRVTTWTGIAMLLAALGLAGCAPLVVVGAGAVIADTAMEADGSDGLF